MMSGICTRKASGVGLRVCLYSAKSSCLRVGPFGSKNMPLDGPFVQNLEHHVEKSEHGVRRRAVRRGELRRQSVEAPECEAVAVYEKQIFFHLTHPYYI